MEEQSTITNVTYIAALAVGAILILSVTFLSLRTKAWTMPSLAAVLLGSLLMGFSVWSQVRISFGADEISAEFQRLREADAELADAVTGLDDNLATTKRQVLRLNETPAAGSGHTSGVIPSVRDSLSLQPRIDRGTLDAIKRARETVGGQD